MDKPLTKTQIHYLDETVTRGRLHQGWGGFSSSQTIHILEERGFVTTRDTSRGWEAQATDKGRSFIRGL